MKLLEGFVKNSTKEVVLTAVLCALFLVTRQFKVTIASGVHLRISIIFFYLAATIVSWKYSLVLPFVAFFTSTSVNPMKALVGITVGIQIVYFLSRRLHGWKKALSFVVATFPANFSGAMVDFLMGFLPFEVAVVTFIPKAIVSALGAIVLGPPLLNTLARMGWFSFEEGLNVQGTEIH